MNREPVVEHLWGSVCLTRVQTVHRSAQHEGVGLRCSSSKKGNQSGEGNQQDGEGGEMMSEDAEEQGSFPEAGETSSDKESLVHISTCPHLQQNEIQYKKPHSHMKQNLRKIQSQLLEEKL